MSVRAYRCQPSAEGKILVSSMAGREIRWAAKEKESPVAKISSLTERKAFAEVDAAHFDVVAKLLRGSRAEDATFGDDVGAIGYAERLGYIVVGDEHSDAAVL